VVRLANANDVVVPCSGAARLPISKLGRWAGALVVSRVYLASGICTRESPVGASSFPFSVLSDSQVSRCKVARGGVYLDCSVKVVRGGECGGVCVCLEQTDRSSLACTKP
jgi:hypothetical protein